MAKILKAVSQEKVVADSIKYIDDRRKGLIPSLKTKYTSLDSYTMNGFELNTITTIGAMSGCGKSVLAKEIRNSIHRLNKGLKFRHYCFNFELLAIHQIARTITSDKKMSLKKLYSVQEELKDVDYNELVKYSEYMKKVPITYFESAGSPHSILATIKHHYEHDCKKDNICMIVEVDHLLLIRDEDNVGDKIKIDTLMEGLVDLKKQISAEGGYVVFICLSQLNRNIKDNDRKFKQDGHYPVTADLMSSSTIEFASDYMLVNHIPAKLSIQKYGLDNLPPYYTEINGTYSKLKQFNYLHLLKNRSGEPDIVFPMYNNFEFFAMDEIKKEVFGEYMKEFNSSGTVTVNLKT